MNAFHRRTIFIVSDEVINHMNATNYEDVTFCLNFTSNLRGGDNFVQIGLGLSTFYDDHVKDNVERNMMAIRSAIILTISEADPVEITTLSGKEALKNALKDAINRVLTNREGFGGIDDVYFTSFVTQ